MTLPQKLQGFSKYLHYYQSDSSQDQQPALKKKQDLVVKAEDWTVGLQGLDLSCIIILPYGPGQVHDSPEGPDLLLVCFGLKNAERL